MSGFVMMFWGYNQAQIQKDVAIAAKKKADGERQRAEQEATKAKKEVENAAMALDVVATALGIQSSVSGPSQTVAELLESLNDMLDSNQAPNSYVEANIRMLLAEGFWRNGKNELGRTQWEKALPLQRQVYGNESLQVAQNLSRLAMARTATGDSPDGEEAARESIRIFQSLPGGSKSTGCISAMAELIPCLLGQGKPEEGLKVGEEALTILRNGDGGDEFWHGWILIHIGSCRMTLGNVEKAQDAYRRAERVFELNDTAPSQFHAIRCLGNTFAQCGQFDEAKTAFQQAVDLSNVLEITGRAKRTNALRQLARIQVFLEDYPTAEKAYRDILQQDLEADEENAGGMIVTRFWLRWLADKLGKNDEAKRQATEMQIVLEQAVASEKSIFEPAADRVSLANALVGRSCEAEHIHRAANLLEEVRELKPEPSEYFLQWLEAVEGRVATAQGNLNQAEAKTRSALSRNKVVIDVSYLLSQDLLIELLRKAEKLEEVEPVLRQGLKDHLSQNGDDGIMTAYARIKLAEFLIEAERLAEARPLLQAASKRILDNDMVPDAKKQAVREMVKTVSSTNDVIVGTTE